jgi:hypothetical protein
VVAPGRAAGLRARPVRGLRRGPVLSAAGLLAVDAWRVRAALALAGQPASQEVLDAVA